MEIHKQLWIQPDFTWGTTESIGVQQQVARLTLKNAKYERGVSNSKFQSRGLNMTENVIEHQVPKVESLLGPNQEQQGGHSLGDM